MNDYIVYMHISPNNKKYIGITCQSEKNRWRNGEGYKNNEYFYRSIKKYGWGNFQHIIIVRGLYKDEAEWLEIELIRIWDSTNRSKGYNITLGGGGSRGRNCSEETKRKIGNSNKGRCLSEEHKRKISESLKGKMSGENHPMYNKHGKDNPNYGKTHTEETKKKISEANKGKQSWNKGKPLSEETKKKISKGHKGVTHTEETKEKISKSHKGMNIGKDNPSAKSVICLTTKKIFYTIKEASEYYNCCSSNIIKCCKGAHKSCGRYKNQRLIWKYLIWKHNKYYRVVSLNK